MAKKPTYEELEQRIKTLEGQNSSHLSLDLPALFQGFEDSFPVGITKQKGAAEALGEIEERAQQYLDIAGVMFVALDNESNITLVNKRALEILGYRQEELLGKNWFKTCLPDRFQKDVLDVYHQLIRGEVEPVEYYENPVLTKDGKERIIAWHNSVLRNPDGEIVGILSSGEDITERFSAEKRLKEANNIINRSPIVTFLWKNEAGWPVEFVSDNVMTLFGYSADDFVSGKISYTAVIHPDDMERVAEEVAIYSEEKGKSEFIHEPYRIITKNGKVKYVDDSTHIRRNQKGRIDYYEGIIIDVTERKKMADALSLKDQVFETSISANSISDEKGILTHVNTAFIRTWGYENKDEVLGKPISDFLKFENEAAKIIAALDETGKWEGGYTGLRKDGTTFSAYGLATIIKDKSGDVMGYQSAVLDNSEHKRMQKELWKSEEKYRSMMEGLKDPIYICSPDYRIEYMNPAMIDSLGRDATGEKCFNAIHHLDEICTWCIHRKISRNECFEYDIVSPRNNRHYRTTNSSIVHEDGSISKLTVFRDTTDFIKMETQLRQSQKMEAIGILAGGVAHDFNNILTIIIGNANLALAEVGKDGPLQEDIAEIKIAGERAASLTRQLLAFSRKQIVHPEILDLNALLTDITKMLGRLIGEDVELLTIPGSALWQVEVDPGQMEQILMNLAVNARDAMPKGGKFTIETTNVDLDGTYFHQHGIEGQPGPYVMLSVNDTGTGIDKEAQNLIFDPFFTTKGIGKGTGLGLSTVYGIVKQNNGFIWVYSEPGQGSTFKVYLPKVKEDTEPEEKERISVEDLSGSETVLVVEDDDSLRALSQRVLQKYGYRVLEAENGEDALKVSKAYEGSIDLMITDVVMPRMGGKETAERLQPLYPHMKVLYMSGHTDDAMVHHGVLTGELNFLQKPFSLKGLTRKVRKILDTE
jgi:PAS domain S-box-containing protein